MLSRIYPGAEGLAFLQGLSLILFLLVFLGVVVMVITMRKGYIDKMSSMPLDFEDDQSTNHGGQ